MTLKSPRLSFSHAGQDFVVKARPTEEGIEARGVLERSLESKNAVLRPGDH